MAGTFGIVQLAGEQGSPLDTLSRRLGGKSLLEWVVRRVTDSLRLDGVQVVFGTSPRDRMLGELVPADVNVVFRPERDRLSQLVAAARAAGATAVIRVCAENPYVDPVLIDQLVREAGDRPGCDYIGYCSRSGQPAVQTPLGAFAEWCSTTALGRADAEASGAERAGVTSFLYQHPERFCIRLLNVPPELDRDDLRLRVDVEEDWEHAQVIHEALGGDEWDWQHLAGLLDHQPALRERMAMLNRAKKVRS